MTFAREAVRDNPDNRELGVLLVKTSLDLRDYAGAESALRPLLERYPHRPTFWHSLARFISRVETTGG